MLERLLAEIRQGGPLTPAILAGRLGTRVEMVNAMLDKLVELRLIQDYNPACQGSSCHGCSLQGVCKPPGQAGGKMWSSSSSSQS